MLNPYLVARLDQVEAFSEQFAGMQNQYHQALLQNGIPEDLAHDMCLQYSNIFWHFVLSHAAEEEEV
jgi:hypothetical protein